jgi:YHS domain-containing protein
MTQYVAHKGEHHDSAGDVICPVCRARVNSATAPSRRFDGDTWFFCNEGCLRAFDKRPGFYAERARTEGLTQPTHGSH